MKHYLRIAEEFQCTAAMEQTKIVTRGGFSGVCGRKAKESTLAQAWKII